MLRITAGHLEKWAAKPEAPHLLPVLVRRLISATSNPKVLAIRGADSINLPSWDGTLNVDDGNPWVPVGESRWEMGCSADVRRKANEDFKTRTQGTPAAQAAKCEFVFVSPRIWARKLAWRDQAANAKHWRDVRVIDADDLEAWLEKAAGVALWFGEQIGLVGSGIESVSRYWDVWSRQTRMPLTVAAISAGRDAQVAALRDSLAKRAAMVVIEADSTEEAVAFVCAQLITPDLESQACCVTLVDGWRFVVANPQLRIVVAATPDVAARREAKDGMTLIVPVSVGDARKYFFGFAAQLAEERSIRLERPNAEAFEKALVTLGEDEADAARWTRTTGRSWSVYRRRRAANPAIATPTWINDPAADILTAVVLVGAWNDSRAGDVACIEAVTGKKYEDLERQLKRLACLDDAPVLQIGAVWKAKAPLELLHLYAPQMPRAELDRFFEAAMAILAKPDPALQLKPEQRWMANVYGKVRNESGIVIDSIADSLAKLRVYAETHPGEPMADAIARGVDHLVHVLLHGADSDRWLSLSNVLRELAEASPDTFLDAVEDSLAQKDAPIRQLFSESVGDVLFGRFWHADLLWALEVLAWPARYLSRVSDILARLAFAPLRENIGNRPSKSLNSLFRPWWPQTTATPEQRLSALDRLICMRNGEAWELLKSILPTHQISASANAKPVWRDDDAGAPSPSDPEGFGEYLSNVGARIVAQARDRADRIADLVQALDSFEGQYREQIVRLVETAGGFPDEDREIIRRSVRKHVSWHFSHNRDGNRRGFDTAKRLRAVFDALAPTDPVLRHAWIFDSGWVELPDGRDDDYERAEKVREQLRADALREVFEAGGWLAVDQLIKRACSKHLVAAHVARAGLPEGEIIAWALRRLEDVGHDFHDSVLSGLLHFLPADRRAAFLEKACENLAPSAIAALASAAPCDRTTWTFLEQRSAEAQEAYWQKVQPGVLVRTEGNDLAYAIGQLVKAKRHRTAFLAVRIEHSNLDPRQLFELLQGICEVPEPDARVPDGWLVGEALNVIERAGAASQRELALLEFAFFRLLEHDQHGTKRLYTEMLVDPELFVDCLKMVYRHEHEVPQQDDDEMKKSMASLGWSILQNGRGVPGLRTDGTVDRAQFDTWTVAVRTMAKAEGRLVPAEVSIGQWLSTCPADPDGTWPCLAVRELLEGGHAGRIREGFVVGVRNNRGVHGRAVGAGGEEERDLAAKYRGFAARVQGTHPQTAAVLENIAKGYDNDARWQDQDAQLWREGTR